MKNPHQTDFHHMLQNHEPFCRPAIVAALLFAIMLAVAYGTAHAAVGSVKASKWELYIGGVKWTGYPNASNPELADSSSFEGCQKARAWKRKKDGETKTTGTSTYRCQQFDSVTFVKNATCPALPDARTVACPAGTTGSWLQTASMGPAPQCTVLWAPTSAPAGACVPNEPEPPAGTWIHCADENDLCEFSGSRVVRFGAVPGSNFDEHVFPSNTANYREGTFTGSVECRLARFTGEDPALFTRKHCWYQTTETTPSPEPSPPAQPNGLTNALSWPLPTVRVDGTPLTNLSITRLYWGTSPEGLTNTIDIAAPANTYTPTQAPGTYYYAARYFTADGLMSALSNVVQKVIAATPPPTGALRWIPCAEGGETCTVPRATRVRNGALPGPYFYRNVSTSISCVNEAFGGDPAPGKYKTCDYETNEAAPPTPPQPIMAGIWSVDAPGSEALNFGYTQVRIGSNGEAITPHDGGGEFRSGCKPSHMGFDDPMVRPNRPGESHHHTFFGNTAVNAFTDLDNLRAVGNTTCDGGTVNKTAYWVPSMIDTVTNKPLVPLEMNIYYKHGYDLPDSEFRKIEAPPVGLRILAGYPMRDSPWPEWSHDFHCELADGSHLFDGSQTIPNCPVGSQLIYGIWFPQCWNGELDSVDHKSHLTWANARPCPASHPRAIPQITEIVKYVVSPGQDTTKWRLSSDINAPGTPSGYSLHADWVNGWDPAIMQIWIDRCVKAADCHSNNLGDGRRLN